MIRTVVSVALLSFASTVAAAEPPPKISGPFTHANLSIFLLHGKDVLPPGQKLLTLQEALEQKKLVVNETSTVNQLSVENTSSDCSVFIQAGDIVKGGKQDRLMAVDMIVPPKSGLLPIASFCCEAGRWTKRGGEDATKFGASIAQAANKDVKLALNAARSQSTVWEKVREAQMKLSKNVGKPVASAASPSSYQLTLEDKDLLAKVDAYVTALKKAADEKNDTVGFVIVINGKVSGAEQYGSHELFLKLWPKLIRAAAVDALSEFDAKKKFEAATAKTVETFLAAAGKGEAKEIAAASIAQANNADRQSANPAGGRQSGSQAPARPAADAKPNPARVTSVDTKAAVMLEAKDRSDGRLLHRSYIAK
jgi:hypothetical protein